MPVPEGALWSPDPHRHTLLARMGPGDGFGEMALLLGGPRRATVRAATPLVLYALDAAGFAGAVNRNRGLAVALEEEMALRGVAASLGRSSPFAKLPPEALRWLAARVQRVHFDPGEDILRQGEPGDALYVILAGRAAVLATRAQETGLEIATLGPGDPFGEQSLLSGEPRSATVRALGPVEALRLGRDDFQFVLREHRAHRDYFLRLALQRQRPLRIDHWALEHQKNRDGTAFYVLKDTQNRRYVRLSEEGAFLWGLMDGRHTVRDLTLAYFAHYQALGLETVLDAMVQLHAAGFVRIQRIDAERVGQATGSGLTERLRTALMPWAIRYFSLPRVDGAAAWLHGSLLRGLYLRPVQGLLLLAALAGTVVFTLYLARGDLELPVGLSLKKLALSVLVSVVLQASLHEVAHAITCKHFGREVHGAGIGWYFFVPVAFADTSDIWMAGKRARVAVALAGPCANFLLGALAALLIPLVESPGWQVTLFQFAVIGYALGLMNLNPLVELDGYYALADWLDVPNLRSKALAFLGAALQGMGGTAGDPRLARIYTTFGVLTLLYALLVAVVFLIVYEGYLEEFVGRFVPPAASGAIGWAIAGLVACAILQPPWREMLDSARRARRAR